MLRCVHCGGESGAILQAYSDENVDTFGIALLYMEIFTSHSSERALD
jgi:hypothetical protein